MANEQNENSISNLPIPEATIASIRTAYVISLIKPKVLKLSKTYGVSKSVIYELIASEDWETARAKYQKSITTSAEMREKIKNQKVKKYQRSQVQNILNLSFVRMHLLLESGAYNPTIKDLDILTRLDSYLAGEPDSKKEINIKLDKPLHLYTKQELLDMRNRVIEGTYELVGTDDEEDEGEENQTNDSQETITDDKTDAEEEYEEL